MEKVHEKDKGYVINIQHYSVHDGPGIRTLVFLKGCPLRCKWCSNPESQKNMPEVAYNEGKCMGVAECGMCINECNKGAIKKIKDKIILDRNLCIQCGNCGEICPSKALWKFGKIMTVNEVIDIVEKDRIFYARSGGGLTVSGGEPFNQPNFTIKLLEEAKKKRINTAVETCGYTEWDNLKRGSKLLDAILFDIKSMDSGKHKQFTGVSNELILENFKRLCKDFPNKMKIVRTPVIPGFNDSVEDIRKIVDFLKDKQNIKYELLPYHRLGQPKYKYIGEKYFMGEARLDDEIFKKLKGEVVDA